MRPRARFAAVSALLLAGLAGDRALAEEARPWAKGIPPERQQEALELYRQGNAEFERSSYLRAAELYRKGIAVWDHPSIRYNLAVALIHLDQPLDAQVSLEHALSFGAAPFSSPALYTEGLTYRKLLEGRLARLEVRCPQAGVEVTMDGQSLLVGPGTVNRTVMPGAHQIVATKRGHVTETRALVLIGGRLETVALELRPFEQATVYRRRWAGWVPWSVLGAGVGVGLSGLLAQQMAQSDLDTYDREVARQCPTGCNADSLPEPVRDLKSSGKVKDIIALTAFSAGGAAVVTGVVLMIMNQPRPFLDERAPGAVRVVALPLDGGTLIGILGSF